MVYMPADVLGWRPAVRSWLDQFLATRHAAHGTGADEALRAPSAEASQLVSPATPGLPGFGRDSSFTGRGGCSGQCPQVMVALRDCVWGMFERFAEPLLQWVSSKGSLMLPLSPATLLASVTTLLETQLDTLAR